MAYRPSAPPLPDYEPLLGDTPSKISGESSTTPSYQPPHQQHPPLSHYAVLGQPQASPLVFGFPVGQPRPSPRWNTSLFGCFSDPGVCCLGCVCPCILFGRIAETLDDGMTSCLAACTIWYILQQFSACGWIYSSGYRSKLQARYGLEHHPLRNCFVHFLCWHCAFCQEFRELKLRRREEMAWNTSAMAPPPQQTMRF